MRALPFLRRSSLGAALAVAAVAAACARPAAQAGGTGDAASRVYVPPGQYDEFYMFASGGFSGQLAVYGLPSGRLLRVIPVFSQDGEKAYGYSEQSKPMLQTSYGFVPWDDAHHPSLSKTDALNDGRWIFINGNNTPRVARIDLAEMNTKEIIEIPNAAGNHASPFVTQGTEYVVAATRFSVPTPQRDVPIASYKENFGGQISFIAVDPKTGKMTLAFQIHMPGFDYDLARPGKGPSHGWAFFTSYNSEQANTLKERNASQNDKDFIAAVNWKVAEQCVAQGKAKSWPTRYAHNWVDAADVAHSEMLTGSKVLEPSDCPGMVYYLPTPKSPRGVDVDSKGIIWASMGGSGHLGRFDRSKCKQTWGDGNQCAEGWTFYKSPGPSVDLGTAPEAQNSADMHYYLWADTHNTLGMGKDTIILCGTNSDSLLAFNQKTNKWTVLRIPYPLNAYMRGLDGRIDNPKTGWKGRGLWMNDGLDPVIHNEVQHGWVGHIQMRPNPLAK